MNRVENEKRRHEGEETKDHILHRSLLFGLYVVKWGDREGRGSFESAAARKQGTRRSLALGPLARSEEPPEDGIPLVPVLNSLSRARSRSHSLRPPPTVSRSRLSHAATLWAIGLPNHNTVYNPQPPTVLLLS